MEILHASCTNRDFAYSSKANSQNADDGTSCAICVVLVQIMENSIQYYNKDITDFIET